MIINPFKRKLIGEILVSRGKLTQQQLDEALDEQQKSGEKIGQILTRLDLITQKDLMEALAFQKGVEYIDLGELGEPDPELRKTVPETLARRFRAVPVSKNNSTLMVAMADPANVIAIEEIEKASELKVTPMLDSEDAVEKHIEKVFGGFSGLSDLTETVEVEIQSDEDEMPSIEDGEYDAEDQPIVKYVNSVITEAVKNNATDIHIEPLEDGVSLRLRIDGELREFPGPAKKAYAAIASRIKVLANLDIAERRFPQDGKIRVFVAGKKVNIRVSTLPSLFGEKVVMRVLQQSGLSLELEQLGFTERDMDLYREALEAPLGMILVTGPTGSGKTTTLYSGLNYINTPERNITTVEDPVEYQIRRINQVQVNAAINLTFANFLRAVLRQDPDVIMVGEIRDRETAEIAIQAALTGHLVLSTLHTNDAVATLTRLRYMGVDTFLIADAVILVIAQRLVRKICPDCREEAKVSGTALKKLGLDPEKAGTLYQGKGCNRCFDTGYRGRTAVYEMLPVSDELTELIIEGAADVKIRAKARESGMVTLREAAVKKMLEGVTTIEEVLTVTF